MLVSPWLIMQAYAQWQSDYYQDHPLVGKIYATAKKQWISEEALHNEIHHTRILLLGETHTNPDHHIGQANLIHQWMPANRNAALVMEMLTYDEWHPYTHKEMSTEDLKEKLDELADFRKKFISGRKCRKYAGKTGFWLFSRDFIISFF